MKVKNNKYADCDRYALQAFKGCHDRVRDGKCPSIQWSRDRLGYLQFCAEIGPRPEGMLKPSVGRIDHSRGYEAGNVQWEEHKFNSVKRKGTKFEGEASIVVELRVLKFKRGTQEHKEFQRANAIARWSNPDQRKRMSIRMRGNTHAAKGKGEK